ncbi:MAG: hypothetical protein MJY87_07195 [Fibrobacter sp.]|nr:hypothetical protein [Fibrobacter sp.]
MKKLACLFLLFLSVFLLDSCAGERQGLVCEEIEYRLNTQTYSPDQRAYIEEELRVCREEEAEKKGADAASRQSIYDRYAASDSAKVKEDVNVSDALQDSSGVATTSIYDRYSSKEGAAEPAAADPTPAGDSEEASDIGNFQ